MGKEISVDATPAHESDVAQKSPMAQQSLKAVSDAERRLGELLESAPDAILELDKEGRIVLLNRMAEQLFGYSREEMLGLTVEACFTFAIPFEQTL